MGEEKQLQKEQKEINPAVKYLTGKLPQISTMLPKHITPEKFLRVVFVQMQKNPDLTQCTKESIYSSMMAAGERGIIPDGYHGHLVPFWNNDKKTGQRWRECQFIPDYKGIMLLARQSGDVSDIFPASIRENDHFEYELGFDRKLIHRPNLLGNRGDIVAVYCVVELKDGAKTFGPGPMTVEEIERVRARSRASQRGPWVTDWEAMAWKTVIKRTLKFIAQSPELRSIIDLDDNQYTEAPAPKPEVVTLEGLMAEPTADVPHETGAPEPEPPAPAQTWPQKAEDGAWVDSAGEAYDSAKHGWSREHNAPSVNRDGTFRAKRRDAESKVPAGKPPEPSPGESDDAPTAGAGPNDEGSSPAPDSPGPSLADVLGLIKAAKEQGSEAKYDDALGLISSLEPGEQRVANDAARAAAEQHNWPAF